MIGNYLKEPDKYLYGVLNNKEQKIYKNQLHCSIEEAVLFAREDLIVHLPQEITVFIYKRNRIIPSECSNIDTIKIFELLKHSDQILSEKNNFVLSNNKMSSVFSSLPYEKMLELTHIINNFLNDNIDTTGLYKVGEILGEKRLPRDEYLKYI